MGNPRDHVHQGGEEAVAAVERPLAEVGLDTLSVRVSGHGRSTGIVVPIRESVDGVRR